jgi:hypothetical protein
MGTMTPTSLDPILATDERNLGSTGSQSEGDSAWAEDSQVAGRPRDDQDPTGETQSRLRSALRTESERLPSTPFVLFLRWWLPAIVCLVGVAIAIVTKFDGEGLDALAAFVGAGSSIWLMNFLWRMGVSGEDERDKEAAARDFLTEHGHWPDEPAPDHGSPGSHPGLP